MSSSSRLVTIASVVNNRPAILAALLAAQAIYTFVWDEYCDWYLEIAKVRFQDEDETSRRMARAVTARVLSQSLHLLHPVTPFVTESISDHIRAKGWFDAQDPDHHSGE